MVNEVILVGRIKDLGLEENNKKDIILEVERPFNDVDGRISDTFICRLWTAIFSKIIRYCKQGDLMAIKGRMINENESSIVMAENVVILNKSRENISNKQ